MTKSGELRQRAERYRRLKRGVSDPRAVRAICELANEFEMTAAVLERHSLVRERAHKIWLERGRPEGRDVEQWLQAERELAGEDQLTQNIRRQA